MMIMDCLTGEKKYEGIPRQKAVELYEELGGARNGYCIGEDVEREKRPAAVVVQREMAPAAGMLF
jgi:hypothetical protein